MTIKDPAEILGRTGSEKEGEEDKVMKMKKLAAVALTAAMVLSLAACGSSSSGKDSYGYMVAMITDTGGVNDQSFNQSAWEGLQKLHADTGMRVNYIESSRCPIL